MRLTQYLVAGLTVAAVTASATPIVEYTYEGGSENWLKFEESATGSSWGQTAGGFAPSAGNRLGSSTGDGGAEFIYHATGGSVPLNWESTVRSVSFDFYADANAFGGAVDEPSSLYFYFGSYATGSGLSGAAWVTPLTVVGGWNHYAFNVGALNQFSYGYDSWSNIGLGGDSYNDFLSAVQNVTDFGIYLTYQPGGFNDQIYGIDNFILNDEYITPEPGSFLFLGMAFASMGVTFRKRLSAGLAKVMGRG